MNIIPPLRQETMPLAVIEPAHSKKTESYLGT